MNDGERKFFLKKFFSFTGSSSYSSSSENVSENGETSPCASKPLIESNNNSNNNEKSSFNESNDLFSVAAAKNAQIKANNNNDASVNSSSEMMICNSSTALLDLAFSSSSSKPKKNHQPPAPSILVDHCNEFQQARRLDEPNGSQNTTDPNASDSAGWLQRKLNNEMADGRGIRGRKQHQKKSLLEQQHSIELKPFRKKEVQIDLDSLKFSFPCEKNANLIEKNDRHGGAAAASVYMSPNTPLTQTTPLSTTAAAASASFAGGLIELAFVENSPRYINHIARQIVSTTVTATASATLRGSVNGSGNQMAAMQLPLNSKYMTIKYRNLGKSGLRVSQFGLGTWVTFGSQISDEVADEILTTAFQNGINLFDTSEVYASGKAELALGRILKKKNWRRSSYVVCTRLYWGGRAETEKGLSRKHIIEGVKASLERLELEYVDIVFACKPDAATPMEEIVRGFTHLVTSERAFYWGTSRWNAMEIMEAYSVARQFNLIPPICEQAEYHLFARDEVELNLPDVNAKIGIGTMTWSPLACGILTGKYEDGVIPVHTRASLKGFGWLKERILNEEGRKKIAKVKELQLIADKLNCTMAQLAIAWCLKNETINCVLLGASSVEQLIENIQSLHVVSKLSLAYMSEIDRIMSNKPISRHTSKSDNLNQKS